MTDDEGGGTERCQAMLSSHSPSLSSWQFCIDAIIVDGRYIYRLINISNWHIKQQMAEVTAWGHRSCVKVRRSTAVVGWCKVLAWDGFLFWVGRATVCLLQFGPIIILQYKINIHGRVSLKIEKICTSLDEVVIFIEWYSLMMCDNTWK